MNKEVTLENYNNKFNKYMFGAIISVLIALILDLKYNNHFDILFYLAPIGFYILDEIKYYRIKSYWRNKK